MDDFVVLLNQKNKNNSFHNVGLTRLQYIESNIIQLINILNIKKKLAIDINFINLTCKMVFVNNIIM